MKLTKELYGIDPAMFWDMKYGEVLELKEQSMKTKKERIVAELFEIGFYPLQDFEKERCAELEEELKEANKALDYVKFWQQEMIDSKRQMEKDNGN